MAKTHPEPDERFEQNVVIAAPPAVVFGCFFKPEALRAWWQAVRSVTTPVVFGVYAVEWASTPYRDDILGTLGGVFHGTVVEVRPGHQFLVGSPRTVVSWRRRTPAARTSTATAATTPPCRCTPSRKRVPR